MELTSIAMRITCAREAKGWNKRQLAIAVGVSPAAVTQWEQGDTKGLKPENLVAVAHALGVLTDWLATGRGPMHDPLTPEVREVVADYLRVPEDRRQVAQKMLKALHEHL